MLDNQCENTHTVKKVYKWVEFYRKNMAHEKALKSLPSSSKFIFIAIGDPTPGS